MSLFRLRFNQFKEYLNLKKKESFLTKRLVSKYKEKDKKNVEYEEFKKSIVYTIDTVFGLNKSKIIIIPKTDKIHLYEKLISDDDFIRYYDCDVKAGNQLVIQMVEI